LRRQVRAAFVLAVLSCVVLADAACVRKVRSVNDNFYVINRKTGATRLPAAPDLNLAVTTTPQPMSMLSNAEILEEENSTISSLLRKAQTDPANASVHFQLGRAYHDFRLYDEALRHYQNALRLEPENPNYHEQTGRLWRDWRSPHLGVDLVKKALDLDPGFVEAWNTLGTIYDRQGNSEQAQDAYLHALSLNSNLDYAHNNLCFSYLQSGKIEQAIRHGERATQLNPTMLVAHNNLGLAYGMLGELDRSLEEFKHGGDEAAARNNLGLMLLKRGQIAESMEQFKLAARMRPYYKDAAANYRRARDLNFQRAREARGRLRSFDREPQMETTPRTLGIVAIENAGLRLLDGTLELLLSHPPVVHPSSSVVEVEIETFGSHADEKEFGELPGTERLRCLDRGA
jgi:tetratricopeptide (TPR) repeat protein